MKKPNNNLLLKEVMDSTSKTIQGQRDIQLRGEAIEFALRNKPHEDRSAIMSGGIITSKAPKPYDVITEAKKIYSWLKTGK